MTNTAANIGIRTQMGTLGMRNFENDGVTQYKAVRHDLWWVNGTTIQKGTTFAYDVGGTSYSKAAIALLRKYWDQEWIAPLV